jgi:hypothetical protein
MITTKKAKTGGTNVYRNGSFIFWTCSEKASSVKKEIEQMERMEAHENK